MTRSVTSLVELSLIDDRVWRLELARPEKRNALNIAMCHELIGELDRCVDNGARAIVITAQGPVFSAGADLGEKDLSGGLYPQLEKLFAHIQRLPVPVIAFIEGPAIGAGMLLAMACDLRVAGGGEGIYFSLPVARMAIGVDTATVRNLELLIGGSRARQMLLAGATMSVEEAQACGFLFPERGEEAVTTLAMTVAGLAPLTLRNLKAELAHASSQPFTEVERDAARTAAWESDDFREVGRARQERRTPVFRGE